MRFDSNQVRHLLKAFNFKSLFIEQLGWDHHIASMEVPVGGQSYELTAIAQKRGVVVFVHEGTIPDDQIRRKIDHRVTKSAHQHFIIFSNTRKGEQVWQWVRREPGKPLVFRQHTFHSNQSGELLIQKLDAIACSLDEEEQLHHVEVTGRVRAAFDTDRVTKRFYDRFKSEHEKFIGFIDGIPDKELRPWYAAVMLNRLMFIYFVQKKRFLDNDINYLHTKLGQSQQRGKDRFYVDFLCPLFFDGFAKKESERSTATNELLGRVPYLNGGLFLRHQVEELHETSILIADIAFEKLFAFFEDFHWHLDERPNSNDREINPDVLGYIFEKYINAIQPGERKAKGAYYTKEDITGYISQNTIISFLFDAARQKCKVAFEGDHAIWGLLQADPDRYMYDAMKHGAALSLPPEIAAGLNDIGKRSGWNKSAPSKYALPTEIWREVIARRKRYEDVRTKLASGSIQQINDLITYNLDIRQFAQDVIENCEGPDLLRAFWRAIQEVTVLDPTCGSGAFLFAALNVLEPLYEACLNRMEVFLDELDRSNTKHRPEKFDDFRKALARVDKHASPRGFIYKSIIVNNLYGVDIMEEAVETCKLRLFLKMVAQVDRVEQIEPLPDIDFNIRTGNTLVGYATLADLKESMKGDWVKRQQLPKIEGNAEIADRAFQKFLEMQIEHGMHSENFRNAKQEVRKRLVILESKLNEYLAEQHGIDYRKTDKYKAWLDSHKPFHWFIEFHGIMKKGGFDVIIGNPPYVVYSADKVGYRVEPRQYDTLPARNLYAFVFERSLDLVKPRSPVGLIVQLTVLSSERLPSLQDLLFSRGGLFVLPFPRRPESIFEGVEMPVAIIVSMPTVSARFSTSRVMRFYTEERPNALAIAKLTDHSIRLDGYRIAKFSRPVEMDISVKIGSHRVLLEALTRRESRWILYYQEACRYWVKACKGLPFFKKNGVKMAPPHGRTICFESEKSAAFAVSLANSSLFYWFYSVFSDCEHINDGLIRGFHIPQDWGRTDWVRLSRRLSASIQATSVRKIITTRQGHTIEYAEIAALNSKSIIDEIDRVLARHYGFTDEELDFIINYDIKYRMGQDTEENGDHNQAA